MNEDGYFFRTKGGKTVFVPYTREIKNNSLGEDLDGNEFYKLTSVNKKTGKVEGYIEYIKNDKGEIHIKINEVYKENRRQGIATAMYRELQKIAGENDIYFDTLTEEGTQLLDKIADLEEYKKGAYGVPYFKGKVNTEDAGEVSKLNTFKKAKESFESEWNKEDKGTARARFYKSLGYDGKPTKVSDEEFAKAVGDNPVMTRSTTHESFEQFMNGEYRTSDVSNSMYGTGIYFAYDEEDKKYYAGLNTKEENKVFDGALSKDAKVIDSRDLDTIRSDLRNTLDRDSIDNIMLADNGVLAASLGYDAIYFDNVKYCLVMNRGKILVNDSAYQTKENSNRYKEAKLDTISDKMVVKLSNGEIVQELSKKEYKKIAEDFASSLNKEELTLIQNYVDAPGISGELNAYNDKDYNGNPGGTKYLYNNTDTNYFTSQNEMNKYYYDLGVQLEEDLRPLKDINPYWPKDDEIAWAGDILGKDATYTQKERLLKCIVNRDPSRDRALPDQKYYTPEQIKEAEETYNKLAPLVEERRKYNWKDNEYDELDKQIHEIGKGKSDSYYKTIADIDKDMVFDDRKYNFDEELEKGNIKYITAKEVYDKRNENHPQGTRFNSVKESVVRKVESFNKLFKEKGVTLDKDIIIFRRGRETDAQVRDGFTMYGLTSCTAFDNLPKKMPSGVHFGDQRYYILLPSGTKILLAEQVIGRGDTSGEYEDVYKGVRRQHEILLAPGTTFERLDSKNTYVNGKFEHSNLLTIKEGENYYE